MTLSPWHGSSALQCRRCLAVARTPASVKTLLKPGAKCDPSPMLQALALAVEQLGWRAQGDGEAAGGAAAAADGAVETGTLFECDGHKVQRSGPYLFCVRCGARVAIGSPKIDALGDVCPSRPPNPARRRAWLVDRRHPATGAKL